MEEGTFITFLGRLMSRQHIDIQHNNNTHSDWTQCTVQLSLLASPTRSEHNCDLACDDTHTPPAVQRFKFDDRFEEQV